MSGKTTDISTDQAYVQEMLHNSAMFASNYVDLQRELNKQNNRNGILTGILVTVFVVAAWGFYEVREAVSVNEIRINRLEAEVGR